MAQQMTAAQFKRTWMNRLKCLHSDKWGPIWGDELDPKMKVYLETTWHRTQAAYQVICRCLNNGSMMWLINWWLTGWSRVAALQ